MSSRTRTLARAFAVLAVTIGAFAWTGSRVDPDALATSFRGAAPGWWAVAVLLVPVQTILAAERWHHTSRALDVPLSRREAWTEFAAGTAVNQVLPGGVAGDVLRVWRQRQQGLARAMRAALVDRWWGQTVLATAVAGAVVWWPQTASKPAGLLVGVLLATLVVASGWVLPQRTPVVGSVSADLRRTARRSPALLFMLGLTLLAAILGGFAACGLALGHAPGIWLVTAAPLGLLAASVPVSAGGWGLREGSLVAVLPHLGWSPEDALALSLLFGLSFLAGALPGLVLLALPAPEPVP